MSFTRFYSYNDEQHEFPIVIYLKEEKNRGKFSNDGVYYILYMYIYICSSNIIYRYDRL